MGGTERAEGERSTALASWHANEMRTGGGD